MAGLFLSSILTIAVGRGEVEGVVTAGMNDGGKKRVGYYEREREHGKTRDFFSSSFFFSKEKKKEGKKGPDAAGTPHNATDRLVCEEVF